MHRDAIVDEVRMHREARAAKFGFDVRAIVEDARKRQETSGHRVVDLSRQAKSKRLRKTTPVNRLCRAKK
jgi:hypothetical protein